MAAWALPWRAVDVVELELLLWAIWTPAFWVVVSFWMNEAAEPVELFEDALWFAVVMD